MTALLRTLLSTLLVVLGGCADAQPERDAVPASYQLLVSAPEWSEIARDRDPLVTDHEQSPACLEPSFYIENDWVEIDTGRCNWVTLEARARFEVTRGQRLHVVVSHYDLSAIDPSQGVVRLQFGACPVWQRTVAIPNPAAVYDEELESPCDVERGGPLLFHLHNHGQNTWQLQELALLR